MDVACSTYGVKQKCTHHFDMIYLLTAVGLRHDGSSRVHTVHIYTQTIHSTTQNKQYIEQTNNT